MRAKMPSHEGFAAHDGVKLHYEVYGEGADTMVFLPPWCIVHSRVYKGQLAGLIVAEVEFDSVEASEAFDAPGWLGREVTDDPAYTNRVLAERGRPA